jgi:hypothetical protein
MGTLDSFYSAGEFFTKATRNGNGKIRRFIVASTLVAGAFAAVLGTDRLPLEEDLVVQKCAQNSAGSLPKFAKEVAADWVRKIDSKIGETPPNWTEIAKGKHTDRYEQICNEYMRRTDQEAIKASKGFNHG